MRNGETAVRTSAAERNSVNDAEPFCYGAVAVRRSAKGTEPLRYRAFAVRNAANGTALLRSGCGTDIGHRMDLD